MIIRLLLLANTILFILAGSKIRIETGESVGVILTFGLITAAFVFFYLLAELSHDIRKLKGER